MVFRKLTGCSQARPSGHKMAAMPPAAQFLWGALKPLESEIGEKKGCAARTPIVN